MKTKEQEFDELVKELSNQCQKELKKRRMRQAIMYVMLILLVAQWVLVKVGENTGKNLIPIAVCMLGIIVILAIILGITEKKL